MKVFIGIEGLELDIGRIMKASHNSTEQKFNASSVLMIFLGRFMILKIFDKLILLLNNFE